MMKRILAALLLTVTGCLPLAAAAQYNAPAVTTVPQSTTTVITTDRALLYPAAPELRLVPADVIHILVFGQAEFNLTVNIDSNGDVDLPFLGRVHLGGMTIPEAQRSLAEQLKNGGVYTNPEVVVTVTEGPSAAATVVGENHANVPIIGQSRLLEVLNRAGGLAANTSHVVTINRPGVSTPIVVDLGTDPARSALANVPIFPGDVIVTGRVGVAFAVGAFKTPGVIQLAGNGPVTLMQAAASFGGASPDARTGDLRLIRTVNGQRTVVKLDMDRVLSGKEPDPILQPNDILFMPTAEWKAILHSGDTSLLFSVAGLALSAIAYMR